MKELKTMKILEQIEQDLLEAVKNHEEETKNTLRLIKAAVHNFQIEKQQGLKDEDIIQVLQKQVSQRKDAASQYQHGNRPELAEKEKQEIKIIAKYLPEQLTDSVLEKIIDEIIGKTGAQSPSQMGTVIGQVMAQVKGQADGKRVAMIVQDKLKS